MAARSVFKRLCLFLIWLAIASQALATTRYVRTTGSNTYTCAQSTNVDTAKQTIAAGLACMAAGDTLIIKAGTYNEGIAQGAIPSGINDGQRTTIQAATGEYVQLTGLNSNSDGLTLYDRSYITIDGLWFTGRIHFGSTATNGLPGLHYFTWKNGGVTDTSARGYPDYAQANISFLGITGSPHTHLLFQNIESSDSGPTTGAGFYANGMADSIVEGCNFHDNAKMGVQQYNAGSVKIANNNIYRNNQFHDNGSFGITVGWGDNTLVYNNLIYGNGGGTAGTGGIWVQYGSPTGSKFYNNTVYGNTGYGIRLEAASNTTTLQNNISYNNTGAEISNAGSGTIASNNLCDSAISGLCAGGNPLFVSTSNFHLQTGSPAIGAAATIGTFSTDYDGVSRPQGSAWDIGAYEYTSPAGITLLGPVGGENWQVGSSQTFTWSTVSTSENVDILLSRNGTFSDTETLFNNLSDDGSEAWTVAGATTSTAKARARLHTTTSTYSTSPATFNISASVTGTITVSAPVSGLHVFPTGSLGITWTYTGVSGNCQIQLSRDGGVTWQTVSASVPLSQMAYDYTVPVGAAYSSCVVKVTSLQDTAVSGTSSTFRIGGTYLLIK